MLKSSISEIQDVNFFWQRIPKSPLQVSVSGACLLAPPPPPPLQNTLHRPCYRVSTCAAERSFCGMKSLKTPLRSTMSKERLSSLAIDLFGLYILFSQYRSCDNTQEVWSFVLFIKMRAYALFLMNKTKDQAS